jgi:Uma2 family endonuclease
MNVQLEPRMDKPEFLTWVQAHEGRYELVGNRVVMMTGGSRGHAILVRRLAAALEKRLDSTRWTVLTSDFGVDVAPSTIRYPDVVVDAAGGRFKDLTATAPVLIAEVISPSSANDDLGADDLGAKAQEYLRLSSLSAYLALAQDAPRARVWAHGRSHGIFAGAEGYRWARCRHRDRIARHRPVARGDLRWCRAPIVRADACRTPDSSRLPERRRTGKGFHFVKNNPMQSRIMVF